MKISDCKIGMEVKGKNSFGLTYVITKINKSTLWVEHTTGERIMKGGKMVAETFVYKNQRPLSSKVLEFLKGETMNYYKITNKKEVHYNLKYKTGLNIDVLPFNPKGNCVPGGIYFSREDILGFLSYGCWIRKVIVPDDAQVYENLGSPKKWKADKVVLGKRRLITAKVIEELIAEGADVHAQNNCALEWASHNGHTDVVKVLLKHGADVHAQNNCALKWASGYRHTDVVKILNKYMSKF